MVSSDSELLQFDKMDDEDVLQLDHFTFLGEDSSLGLLLLEPRGRKTECKLELRRPFPGNMKPETQVQSQPLSSLRPSQPGLAASSGGLVSLVSLCHSLLSFR